MRSSCFPPARHSGCPGNQPCSHSIGSVCDCCSATPIPPILPCAGRITSSRPPAWWHPLAFWCGRDGVAGGLPLPSVVPSYPRGKFIGLVPPVLPLTWVAVAGPLIVKCPISDQPHGGIFSLLFPSNPYSYGLIFLCSMLTHCDGCYSNLSPIRWGIW